MKLLILPFINANFNDTNMLANYVVDGIIHGARRLFGSNAVDAYRLWYLYKDTAEENKDKLRYLWGRGFSYTGTLDEEEIDRTDLDHKIQARYFDKILIPIHHSKCNHYSDMHIMLDFLLQFYKRNDIAFIDSWDLPHFDESVGKRCIYFKRELYDDRTHLAHPLGGGWIPKEKYRTKIEKTVDFAPLVPASHLNVPNNIEHRKTYIYNDEESYYRQYQESLYAYTCKKGGWDCMRHYEILASYTMPFFTDIEICPKNCLVHYPKDMLKQAKKIAGVIPSMDDISVIKGCENVKPDKGYIDKILFNQDEYNKLLEEMIVYSKKFLNTEYMVTSILDNMERQYGNFR